MERGGERKIHKSAVKALVGKLIGWLLTWASDNSWKGVIRENEVLALSKYDPRKIFREKVEAEESHDSS